MMMRSFMVISIGLENGSRGLARPGFEIRRTAVLFDDPCFDDLLIIFQTIWLSVATIFRMLSISNREMLWITPVSAADVFLGPDFGTSKAASTSILIGPSMVSSFPFPDCENRQLALIGPGRSGE